jgi:hypothetical protein
MFIAVLAGVAALAGCGGPCAEIAARRHTLSERHEVAAGSHARVVIPLEAANRLLAELIRDPPLRVPLALPELGPFGLAVGELSAVARSVELQPAAPGKLRFAVTLEIDDAAQAVTTLAVVAEVAPELVRRGEVSELVAGFGPENLVAVRPVLGEDAGRTVVDAVGRWVPARLRDRLPRAVVDRAAAALTTYLTGQAYDLLRATLLRRLGELTRLRVELPALPITAAAVTSTADALTVDLTTDLPVRRGLPAATAAARDAVVEISQSTAAELANWSIARGHLPQRYTRNLEPRSDGEYSPLLDYLAGDPRPVKIHIFQDRGGCSYFQVGLRYQLAIVDDKLVVDVRDRYVEAAQASTSLELALWLKQLIQGSVDRSYRAAAHTRLTIGGRAFEARVVRATVTDDALGFHVEFAPLR